MSVFNSLGLVAPLPTLAGAIEIVNGLVMVLFVLSALLLMLIVLLQEGKGGGLAGAFGGAGAEAFGVKAGTVNKFTAWLGGFFLGLALLYAGLGALDASEAGKLGGTASTEGLEDPAGDATGAGDPGAADPLGAGNNAAGGNNNGAGNNAGGGNNNGAGNNAGDDDDDN